MGSALVVNLPGSTGGVRDGAVVLAPVVLHALEQLAGGGDHAPDSPGPGPTAEADERARLAGPAAARCHRGPPAARA
jgi:hypothetical protein